MEQAKEGLLVHPKSMVQKHHPVKGMWQGTENTAQETPQGIPEPK